MYLQNAIFKNIAPFGNLDLIFKETQVIVFSGINGRGKTTILSYIADAFFEIARAAKFKDILEDNTKYYRVTSATTTLEGAAYSLVYLRFVSDKENIDYIEIVGQITKAEYESSVTLENKIDFNEFSSVLADNSSYKAAKVKAKIARNLFEQNILTYFPSDRTEVPAWMNDIEYKKTSI